MLYRIEGAFVFQLTMCVSKFSNENYFLRKFSKEILKYILHFLEQRLTENQNFIQDSGAGTLQYFMSYLRTAYLKYYSMKLEVEEGVTTYWFTKIFLVDVISQIKKAWFTEFLGALVLSRYRNMYQQFHLFTTEFPSLPEAMVGDEMDQYKGSKY